MPKTTRAPRQPAKVVQLRKGTTLEMVRLACPDTTQATLISESFGLPVLDSDGIRDLAADMALQSHALRMAAEGAVAAYEQVVGERWKPFERPVENPGQTIDRKAAAVQMAAFG